MQVAEPPPVAQSGPPPVAEVVVVRRDSRTDLVLSTDTPLPLIKAGRTEDALLRQAVFVSGVVTVVRSTAPPNAEAVRWTYEPFLQRQLCFTSMTGQFSCTVAEVTALPEKSSGEAPNAPQPPDGAGPAAASAAEAARAALSDSLRTRGPVLFREDRRLKVEPMLKAAGVSVRTPSGTAAARRP